MYRRDRAPDPAVSEVASGNVRTRSDRSCAPSRRERRRGYFFAGACFALSSDAHLPEQVGFGYDQALEFLEQLGVGEIAVFEGRERRLEPLGAVVGEN